MLGPLLFILSLCGRSCGHCRPPRCHAAIVRRRYSAVPACLRADVAAAATQLKCALPTSVSGCLPYTYTNRTPTRPSCFGPGRHSVSQFEGRGPTIQLGADTVLPGTLKMTDMKMTDQIAGHENAGHEIARHDKYLFILENLM